jgi:energy-coupling factor transport system permease protein
MSLLIIKGSKMIAWQNLTLGQYLPGDSPLHRLDPRTKLCSAMGLMVVLLWVQHLPVFAVMLFLLLGVTRLAALPLGMVLRNLYAFRWLLLITFAAHALFTPGQPVAAFGVAMPGLTREGLTQGALFTLRLMVILSIAAVLMLTTAPLDVADGLEALLKPFRRLGLPAHELAMMMVIALRFIPTLVEEADRLYKAQIARGADFSGNPLRRARKMTALLIPLMVSAFRRADDLAIAMEARCYRGGIGRTHYRELALTRNDYLAIGCMTGLMAGTWLLTA